MPSELPNACPCAGTLRPPALATSVRPSLWPEALDLSLSLGRESDTAILKRAHPSLAPINLQNKTASYFTSKNGFTWDQQRIAIGDKPQQNQRQVQGTKGRTALLERKGAVINRKSIGANGSSTVAASLWLGGDCLSLAGPGQEKTFLPPSG